MYDLAIIGAGPAGMSAGIYAGRFRMKTLIISKDIGGTCNTAHLVENYPGFKSISGIELMQKFKEHLDDYKDIVEVKQEEVKGAVKVEDGFELLTSKGKYNSKSLLIASGTKRRQLNIPGEKELLGKGVSYCATCDAGFFKNKTVGVVGGSNSAVTAALLLSEYADKVYLVYRKEKITRAEPVWVKRMEENEKIEAIYSTNIVKIKGDNLIKSVELDKPYNKSKDLAVDGLFIEIGSYPMMGLAKRLGVETDKNDLVVVDDVGRTNIEGIYAAGDVTTSFENWKQVIAAAADGAAAASTAYKWITAQNK
jgi:thioredoxin reductase (NADPH)